VGHPAHRLSAKISMLIGYKVDNGPIQTVGQTIFASNNTDNSG
jgi:hypothetical protein